MFLIFPGGMGDSAHCASIPSLTCFLSSQMDSWRYVETFPVSVTALRAVIGHLTRYLVSPLQWLSSWSVQAATLEDTAAVDGSEARGRSSIGASGFVSDPGFGCRARGAQSDPIKLVNTGRLNSLCILSSDRPRVSGMKTVSTIAVMTVRPPKRKYAPYAEADSRIGVTSATSQLVNYAMSVTSKSKKENSTHKRRRHADRVSCGSGISR